LPLYEYECKKCGHKFEKIQLFSDKPIKKCPECGGAVEKLISRSAVQFKGSGWYATDYAKKSGGDSSSAASNAVDDSSASKASEGKKSEESKTPAADSKESKPKAKSESSEKKSHKK